MNLKYILAISLAINNNKKVKGVEILISKTNSHKLFLPGVALIFQCCICIIYYILCNRLVHVNLWEIWTCRKYSKIFKFKEFNNLIYKMHVNQIHFNWLFCNIDIYVFDYKQINTKQNYVYFHENMKDWIKRIAK